MRRSSIPLTNGLALESVLDCYYFFVFLNHGLFRAFLLKFINESAHLCVRPFNFIKNLFMVMESVVWQVVDNL